MVALATTLAGVRRWFYGNIGLRHILQFENAVLVINGVHFEPVTRAKQVTQVRRGLYECEPDVTLEVVKQLKDHKACAEEAIDELLRMPTMKKHLADVSPRLLSLGFDVRTKEQKKKEKQHEEAY